MQSFFLACGVPITVKYLVPSKNTTSCKMHLLLPSPLPVTALKLMFLSDEIKTVPQNIVLLGAPADLLWQDYLKPFFPVPSLVLWHTYVFIYINIYMYVNGCPLGSSRERSALSWNLFSLKLCGSRNIPPSFKECLEGGLCGAHLHTSLKVSCLYKC